jgi:hypothetical protein
MNLDFTRLDSIAPRTNGEAPREPARAGGVQIHPKPLRGHTEPTIPLQTQADYERIVGAAKKIIENDRINHEIEKGCRLQVLLDIERKSNPYWLLLVLAEAVGRLSRCGDSYFLEVKQKLIDVYGHDISEDPVNPDTGFVDLF